MCAYMFIYSESSFVIRSVIFIYKYTAAPRIHTNISWILLYEATVICHKFIKLFRFICEAACKYHFYFSPKIRFLFSKWPLRSFLSIWHWMYLKTNSCKWFFISMFWIMNKNMSWLKTKKSRVSLHNGGDRGTVAIHDFLWIINGHKL